MNAFPRWLSISVGYLFAILLAVITLALLNNMTVQNQKVDSSHTLTVSATGKVEAVPDLAVINGSVVIEGTTAQEVKSKSVQKGNDVSSALAALGVEKKDIKNDYYLNPKYSYNSKDGTSNIVGYVANETFTVKVRKIDSVGQVVDAMTSNGINQVGDVNYTFDDPDKFLQQARVQALQNAKQKAQELASTAGIALGKLITFQEQTGGMPLPMMQDRAYGMGGAAAAPAQSIPQLSAGTNEVTADVSVTYQLP